MTALLAKAGRSASWLVLAAGTGAFWLGGDVILLLFALASAAAIAGFLRLDASTRGGPSLPTLGALLCVPLQYAFIARSRLDLAIVVLPLIITMVIPLLTLLERQTARFLPAMTRQHIGIVLWIYCLSHAPALLLLDMSGFEAPRTHLIAFLVVLSFTSHALWRFPAQWKHRAESPLASARRSPMLWIPALTVVATMGALLSWMSPFSPAAAIAMALLIAAFSWLGCFAISALDSACNERWQTRTVEIMDGVPYPYALAFAAPPFLHAVRAWSAW